MFAFLASSAMAGSEFAKLPAPHASIQPLEQMRLRGGASILPTSLSSVGKAAVKVVSQDQTSVKVVLRFRTNYKTRFGENVIIVGSLAELGGVETPTVTDVQKAAESGKGARMQYIKNDDWGLDMALELSPDADPPPVVQYRYCIVDDNKQHPPICEGGSKNGRILNLAGPADTYPAVMEIRDIWKSQSSLSSIFLSSAFSDVIFNDKLRSEQVVRAFKRTSSTGSANKDENLISVRLTIENPRVEPGHVMAVIGSCTALGNWEDGKVTPMSGLNYPLWEVEVDVPMHQMPLYYRYVIMEEKTKKVLAVEQGESAHKVEASPQDLEESLAVMKITDAGGKTCNRCMVVVNDDPDPAVSKNPLFKSQWRGAGVAVPVFGLRSDKGMGVGEFADIKGLVDWCRKAGLKMIQLLPVTDTISHSPSDERDSYPYSSISVHALHPMYLRLNDIEGLSAALKADIEKEAKRLNEDNYYKEAQWDKDLKTELDRPIDYPEVMRVKTGFLRRAFKEIGAKVMESEEYKEFFDRAEFWLRPYGLFCWLRDFFGSANPDEWGKLGTGINKEKLMSMTDEDSEFYKGISFYWFVQFLCHEQLLDASKYAATNGVVLKGDLPIGIDHDSVDAWYHPHLFHMNKKTGAPPDDYSEMGQNWGFPTYNWEAMQRDGFSWWRSRLNWMSQYFHAYRIDHILGFFRIWEMPSSATGGLLGRFRPSLPIHRDELRNAGMEHQIDRLCNPHVKKHLMERFFGHDWMRVKNRFFDDDGYETFKFKQGLCSEVEIEKIVEREGSCVGYKSKEEMIYNLKLLINNVVLLRDDDRPHEAFYPRIEMWKTTSFQELPGDMQNKLRNLYQSYFYGRQDQYWADAAMLKLPPLLDASRMMVCGEDLGMIPACVKGVLEQLVIMGLKIQRMPAPGESQGKFGNPDKYPYLSVCTPSCHDMSTVAGWWEEMPAHLRKEFWNVLLQRPGDPPHKFSTEIISMIVEQHMWSPSIWAVFPIQDFLAMDHHFASPNPRADQINWPPNPQHYWRWRSRISLQQLMQREDFSLRIRQLVEKSGRLGGY